MKKDSHAGMLERDSTIFFMNTLVILLKKAWFCWMSDPGGSFWGSTSRRSLNWMSLSMGSFSTFWRNSLPSMLENVERSLLA